MQTQTIQTLFDPSKDIYRTIQKVIMYSASQEARLKAEITEYIVTESIEEQFESLLTRIQAAMESGEGHEIGVWVSGFYGSGKSSFTKYLGMALDENVYIEGIPFLQYLQDRLHKPQTKALLSTVAKRFPAAVVLLDLASEMLAGATMEEVSTVLYYKVLQWAGYSRHLKVAAFERKLKKDGRFEEFEQLVQSETSMRWNAIQNDALVLEMILSNLAFKMYPNLFHQGSSFSLDTNDFIVFENDRVLEMLEIVREKTGRQNILFIIDEVGQYVGSRTNLILNLDGLAKNIKDIGGGKVWIVGTAQQTLTEDNTRAALNSSELYKLKDRFPINVDLASNDIKEICYRRLLGKSPAGEKLLGEIFDQYGQSLRHHTKLNDAVFYDSNFNKQSFINLYPFLPAHFDILIHLLHSLAKATGGVGLRSAIKVIQDILIEGNDTRTSIAERTIGMLATTVTLFDALEKDIKQADQTIYNAFSKVYIQYKNSSLHYDIAKTVAVLQMIGNIPITSHNICGLMHPTIEASSQLEEVEKALTEMIHNPLFPFGEQDGNLGFFSEKLNVIEQERSQLVSRVGDNTRIFNDAIKEIYSTLPRVSLFDSLVITGGLRVRRRSVDSPLLGEQNPIQIGIEFVEYSEYDTARTRLIEESRHTSSKTTIYLLARNKAELDEKCIEIYRSREIARMYRNDTDKDIKKYCNSQDERAAKLFTELQLELTRSLTSGSFIFRGHASAIETLDTTLLEASRKQLAVSGEMIFDRYQEASFRADTSLAEQFLRAGNLSAITLKIDPLELVQNKNGRRTINVEHKAMLSIVDYLDRSGSVDGKELVDFFTSSPFGWSPDTLRYLVAALLVAGQIKLRSGRMDITVNGQQAIDALKTNQAFRIVKVGLRDERPSNEDLDRAATRLTELMGEQVYPLEDDIGKASLKLINQIQPRCMALEVRLNQFQLQGGERIHSLTRYFDDIRMTDGSDAPKQFGSEHSFLYENIRWVYEVERKLKLGLGDTIIELIQHRNEIASLPGIEITGRLKEEVKDDLESFIQRLNRDDFYEHDTFFNTTLTNIKARIRVAVERMVEEQNKYIRSASEELRGLEEWREFSLEEQDHALAKLEALEMPANFDLQGLKSLQMQELATLALLRALKESIKRQGQERIKQRLQQQIEEEQSKDPDVGKVKLTRNVHISARVRNTEELDNLIRELQQIKQEWSIHGELEVTFNVKE